MLAANKKKNFKARIFYRNSFIMVRLTKDQILNFHRFPAVFWISTGNSAVFSINWKNVYSSLVNRISFKCGSNKIHHQIIYHVTYNLSGLLYSEMLSDSKSKKQKYPLQIHKLVSVSKKRIDFSISTNLKLKCIFLIKTAKI